MDSIFGWLFDIILSRMIAIRPVVCFPRNQLVIKSDWRTLMWSLGAWSRNITVDRQLAEVRIRQRTFWVFIKRIIIRFDEVAEVYYGYADAAPASAFSFIAYQSDDLYTISLKLKRGQVIKLCRFFGEGGFNYNGIMPDWWYWEDALHARLTQVDQSDASLNVADMLSQIIGVPIGNPSPY